MFYYFKHLFLLRNTAFLTEKNGILMHLVLCTMPLYYLSEKPDVATGREHGSRFVWPGQAAQRKASRGDARQGKPSRCVGQARRERCPLVLKNTVCLAMLLKGWWAVGHLRLHFRNLCNITWFVIFVCVHFFLVGHVYKFNKIYLCVVTKSSVVWYNSHQPQANILCIFWCICFPCY